MVSKVKLIQRVSKAFQHLGSEGGVVRLRLAPAELGSIQVEMRINQRKVQARVVAETEAASAALREHLPDLRARLESYGMQIERLEIENGGDRHQQQSHFDDQSRRQMQEQAGHQPRRENSAGLQSSERGDVPREVSPMSRIENLNSGVDIRL